MPRCRHLSRKQRETQKGAEPRLPFSYTPLPRWPTVAVEKREREEEKRHFSCPPLPRIFPFVIDETREKQLNRQCVLFRWIYIGVFACVCMNVYGGGGWYRCGIK